MIKNHDRKRGEKIGRAVGGVSADCGIGRCGGVGGGEVKVEIKR